METFTYYTEGKRIYIHTKAIKRMSSHVNSRRNKIINVRFRSIVQKPVPRLYFMLYNLQTQNKNTTLCILDKHVNTNQAGSRLKQKLEFVI